MKLLIPIGAVSTVLPENLTREVATRGTRPWINP